MALSLHERIMCGVTIGDDKVPFQPKQSMNLQGNPPSFGKSQDQIFWSVTMPGSKIAGAAHVKSYEIISSAWEVHQAMLALPVSHRPKDLECWEQNQSRNTQKGFKVNITLLRRKRGKRNLKTLMALNLAFQHGKSQFGDFFWTCWKAWAIQPAQQAQGGNSRSCCKSGPKYLSRAVWEARPGVEGEQQLLKEQELAGISERSSKSICL